MLFQKIANKVSKTGEGTNNACRENIVFIASAERYECIRGLENGESSIISLVNTAARKVFNPVAGLIKRDR